MIVAHPDDETFWGGGTLAKESDWGVICLTHSRNRARQRAFHRATRTLGVPSMMLDLPDRKEHAIPQADLSWMADKLSSFVNADHVDQVMTHGPDGEYGHPLHRALSSAVEEVCIKRERLWFFNFNADRNLETEDTNTWGRKMQAVSCYLGSKDHNWDPADRCHVQLSRHENPVRADEYQRPWDLVARTYASSGMAIS